MPAIAQQNVCPCVPVTKLWVTKVCDSWDCAASEFTLGNGDATMIVLPSSLNQWVTIRQVVSGGYMDQSPYLLETFDDMASAGARYSAIAVDHNPMIVSATGGKLLVISLREAPPPRRRAVR